MPDRISNYRQVRLIFNPHEGDWSRCYWSIHFLSVRQGIPRSEIAADGVLFMGTETPTQAEFWAMLRSLAGEQLGQG